MNQILECQKNYRAFEAIWGSQEINDNPLIKYCAYDKACGRILFVKMNSAWMSKLHEISGSLLIPENYLDEIDLNDFDLVITLIHHPLNWLNAENALAIKRHVQQSTDLLFIGHEHRKEEIRLNSKNWSNIHFFGNELQNSDDLNDSSFSAYVLDNGFSMLKQIDYCWDQYANIYQRTY